MWRPTLFDITGGMSSLFRRIAQRFRALRSSRQKGEPEPVSPEQHRLDMIYIWTEIHSVPRERAEAMYEEFERASTVASLGLRGK